MHTIRGITRLAGLIAPLLRLDFVSRLRLGFASAINCAEKIRNNSLVSEIRLYLLSDARKVFVSSISAGRSTLETLSGHNRR